MGFRDYNPGLNRFTTRDTYTGALNDLALGLNPFTGNRYAFGAGNPITNIELDGHEPCHSNCDLMYSGTKDDRPRYPKGFRTTPPVGGDVQGDARNQVKDYEGAVRDKQTAQDYLQAKLAFCARYPDDEMCQARDLHDDLDMIGLIPGLGEPADILNAAIYAAEGDYKNAGLSAASAIPGAAGYIASAIKRARRASKACNSFIPGAPVLMADGTRKPIEKIKKGDEVLATNPKTGKTEAKTVTALIRGEGQKHLVQITIDGTQSRPFWLKTSTQDLPGVGLHVTDHHTPGSVVATDGHPFWVADPNGGKWFDAGQLKPGMWLRTSAGTYVQITATRHWTTRQRVHNLTIADHHTYYVQAGNTALLVHNSGAETCAIGQAGEAAAGITKNTETLVINNRARIPDELTGKVIGEVKNVRYQYLSTQIKDYLSYAQQEGLQFNLYVRRSTRLSGPLQELVDSRDINLIRNLP